jgi:acyl-coenzyme A thioesterase PaaI-like protein
VTADSSRAPHPAVDGRAAELRALADAIRDLIDATVTTDAPASVTADVARRVDELTAALREHTPSTPYPRFVFTPDDVEETPLADRMPFDAVVGAYNPIALPVDVTVVDGKAIGRACFTTPFEGPPGCVQGGVIAAAFDIVLSAANRAAQAAGPTVSLTMRYRRPTLLHRDLTVECEVVSTDGRRTRSVGRIVQDDQVTVEAEGVFAVIDPKTIASFRERLSS